LPKKELNGNHLKDYSMAEIIENDELRKLFLKNAEEKRKRHNEIMKKFATS